MNVPNPIPHESPASPDAADEAGGPPRRRSRRAGDKTSRRAGNKTSRRAGYAAVLVVNILVLYLVNQLPDWDVPLLTPDLAEALPWINAGLTASVVANLVWLAHDPPWLRSLLQVGVNGLNLVATVRVWQVFPFEADLSDPVEFMIRALLVIAIVATLVATIFELGRLAGGARPSDSP